MSNNFATATRTPAVVVGLDNVTGLQTARILAQHNIPVIGLAKDPLSHFCRTKACKGVLQANTDNGDLLSGLLALASELKERPVLFPCSDASVLLISRNRRQLEDSFHIALPDAQVVETLMDKVGFYRYAMERELPIPQTFFISSGEDLEDAIRALTFPCILKPPLKTDLWEKNSKAKVLKIPDVNSLRKIYQDCSRWAEMLILQEWVEGTDNDLFSCNCYFNQQSVPLVTFISRKIRQWPPETGVSSLGEECRNDLVLEQSIQLFQSIGYRGLGYVEMKRDVRTGKHFIIEPNIGRPTARSAIAEAGGVSLLYAAYCDILGEPLPANLQQKYGKAKWIYLRRDIQSAVHYWRQGTLPLKQWLQSWQGVRRDAVFSWTDPGPFWGELRRCVRLIVTNRERLSKSPLRQWAVGFRSFPKGDQL